MRDSRKNKGSLTMEASLVVPIFTFAILTIILFMKLVYVQEIMQKAINDSANGIAQFAYVYEASGFKKIGDKLVDNTNKGAALAEEHLAKTTQAIDAFSQIEQGKEKLTSGDFSDVKDYVKETNESLNTASDNIESIIKDIKEKGGVKREAVSIISLVGKCMLGETNKQATRVITTLMMYNSLEGDGMSANDRLKSLHVVQSLWQLDFDESSMFMDKDHKEVNVIVTYEVKIPIPFNLIPKFTVTQRASALAWLGK